MALKDEKLAKSLTAESVELIPYLSYLLQDLWELGSSPKKMIRMIKEYIDAPEKLNVLDLACGKGAVSVNVAKVVGCSVKGIDILPDFIAYARGKAKEHNVKDLCEFAVGDIRSEITEEKDYDLVIFGAVGDVLGTPEATIEVLKKTITPEGYILIDDAYGKESKKTECYTKAQWMDVLKNTGVRLIEEKVVDPDELETLNREQQRYIVDRANELKIKHPEKAHLFDSYIKSQQEECDQLENEITGVTLLLKVDN